MAASISSRSSSSGLELASASSRESAEQVQSGQKSDQSAASTVSSPEAILNIQPPAQLVREAVKASTVASASIPKPPSVDSTEAETSKIAEFLANKDVKLNKKNCCTPAKYVYFSCLLSAIMGGVASGLSAYNSPPYCDTNYYNSSLGSFDYYRGNYICCTNDCAGCSASLPIYTPLPPVPPPLPPSFLFFPQQYFWLLNAIAVTSLGIGLFSIIKTGLNQKGHSCKFVRKQWVCTILTAIVVAPMGIATLYLGANGLGAPSLCPPYTVTCQVINVCSSAWRAYTRVIGSCANFSYSGPCAYQIG